MRQVKGTTTIMVLVLVLISAVTAAAQQGFPPGPPMGMTAFDDDGDPAAMERREEVRKKVETVRLFRLTEALKLDERTSDRVAVLFGSISQKRKEAMREGRAAMLELREALKAAAPDERRLKSLLERIEKHHHEMMELREKEVKELKDLLTVEQQARYILFQRAFMREMRGMIAGAAGGKGPGMHGPGGGRGPGGGPRGDGTGKPPE